MSIDPPSLHELDSLEDITMDSVETLVQDSPEEVTNVLPPRRTGERRDSDHLPELLHLDSSPGLSTEVTMPRATTGPEKSFSGGSSKQKEETFTPMEPHQWEELGLSRTFVEHLVLKHLLDFPGHDRILTGQADLGIGKTGASVDLASTRLHVNTLDCPGRCKRRGKQDGKDRGGKQEGLIREHGFSSLDGKHML